TSPALSFVVAATAADVTQVEVGLIVAKWKLFTKCNYWGGRSRRHEHLCALMFGFRYHLICLYGAARLYYCVNSNTFTSTQPLLPFSIPVYPFTPTRPWNHFQPPLSLVLVAAKG
ncbi:Hypothetical predicted protein, partial [Drosophila guanche]